MPAVPRGNAMVVKVARLTRRIGRLGREESSITPHLSAAQTLRDAARLHAVAQETIHQAVELEWLSREEAQSSRRRLLGTEILPIRKDRNSVRTLGMNASL